MVKKWGILGLNVILLSVNMIEQSDLFFLTCGQMVLLVCSRDGQSWMSTGPGRDKALTKLSHSRLYVLPTAQGDWHSLLQPEHPWHRQRPRRLRCSDPQRGRLLFRCLSGLLENQGFSASFSFLCGFSFIVILVCAPSVCAGSSELLKFSKKASSDLSAYSPVRS